MPSPLGGMAALCNPVGVSQRSHHFSPGRIKCNWGVLSKMAIDFIKFSVFTKTENYQVWSMFVLRRINRELPNFTLTFAAFGDRPIRLHLEIKKNNE